MSDDHLNLSEEQLESLNNEIKEVVDDLVEDNVDPLPWWRRLINCLFGERSKR